MREIEECPCGGEVEVENVGEYKDRVCQNCGLILHSEKVVEDQEVQENEEYEVME